MINDNQRTTGESLGCAGGSGGGNSCCRGPAKWIWLGLVIVITGVLIARNMKKAETAAGKETEKSVKVEQSATGVKTGAMDSEKNLPRLIDLGATKCIPCKMMAPILEDLKKSQTDKFEVQFIDVWQNPDSGRKYGIRMIPTQIFSAPDGKELFRHEGFFGKDDILAKWKELGF